MARAARNAGRQAARLGLLAALAGCAVIEDPPGGPPDFEPPVVLSITPDSGAVVPELDDALVIQFDEVISETSGGGLENIIRLSPRAEELEVRWKRTAIHVEPKGGWFPGVVYHVVLEPGVVDLRNNRMEEGRTVVFSTGGPVPATLISGAVLDWENARPARLALIEAVLLPDSLVYTATADSLGFYRLGAIPPGSYLVSATVDDNNNRRREPREPFDSVTVALDSLASHMFWTFSRDTAGPQVRRVSLADSMTIEVQFSLSLDTVPHGPEAAAVWALPDTIPVVVAGVWEKAVYDSVAAEEAAARAPVDTLAADTLAADTAATDTTAARQPAAATRGPQIPQALAELLTTRPALSNVWYIRMAQPLTPGGRYLIEGRARSIGGSVGESSSVLIMPAPRDST